MKPFLTLALLIGNLVLVSGCTDLMPDLSSAGGVAKINYIDNYYAGDYYMAEYYINDTNRSYCSDGYCYQPHHRFSR